jgi:ABC-type Zn uptake system ZnuABC Zn-binding protein ZnuA
VVSLTDELVYLTSDQLVEVAGYLPDEGDWANEDLQALTKLIRDNEVPVVIHKWMPDDKVVAAIAAAGAKIVVLSTIDPGLDAGDQELDRQGYMKSMRRNLETLYQGFSK